MFLQHRLANNGAIAALNRGWRNLCLGVFNKGVSSSHGNQETKKRVVFLGTPAVAVATLAQLLKASKDKDSIFDIVAVVSKKIEGASKKHHHRDASQAMTQLCQEHHIPQLYPEKASDAKFIEKISTFDPDLCITAAYGNYLPSSFLKIPRYGTLNIHPSLLPRYRGASPVQRCLERGDEMTGVTVLYTVRQMDAGPIVSQKNMILKGNEKSSEVLGKLFQLGTEDLIRLLPTIFQCQNILRHKADSGIKFSSAQVLHLSSLPHVHIQDEEVATDASKLSAEEAQIHFDKMTANEIHNRCRGFSEWPGVWSHFYLCTTPSEEYENKVNIKPNYIKIKLITTCLFDCHPAIGRQDTNTNIDNEVIYHMVPSQRSGKDHSAKKGCFVVTCGDGSLLGIEELQPVGKKIMAAKNFFNGLRGRKLMYAFSA